MIVAAFMALGTPPSQAASTKARERDAKTACLSGDYAKGVGILAKLYVETDNPTYIYNQGRCFEQNMQYESAISRFKEYLRKATDNSAEAADAEKHITECEAELAKKSAPMAQPAAVPPPTTSPLPPAAPAPPTTAAPVSPPPPSPPTAGALDVSARPEPDTATVASEPIYKKWWLWTVVGVVAAGSVTAFVLANRSVDACDGASHACLGVK